jgi:benzylsuccinate CoA-transferase BbsF subunit
VKPDIIMVSTCLLGQTRPMTHFAGFGNLAAAISGFYNLAGWPDRPPAGPFFAHTDAAAPRFTAAAILAALVYRRRTSQGQYIDQWQAESSLHFLGPALLDYTVNGRVQGRIGNPDPRMAPHGVYPAAGEDRWIAIAVGTNTQWEALCRVMQPPDLIEDERFATRSARLKNQDELGTLIAAGTQERDAHETEAVLEAVLKERGIPANAVLPTYDLQQSQQSQQSKAIKGVRVNRLLALVALHPVVCHLAVTD